MKNNSKMKIKNEMTTNITKPPRGSPKQVTSLEVFERKVSKMSYSESEPDFSNFAINSLSTFCPIFSESKSESESDFNSVLSLFYIYTLLNKLADNFFYLVSKKNQ